MLNKNDTVEPTWKSRVTSGHAPLLLLFLHFLSNIKGCIKDMDFISWISPLKCSYSKSCSTLCAMWVFSTGTLIRRGRATVSGALLRIWNEDVNEKPSSCRPCCLKTEKCALSFSQNNLQESRTFDFNQTFDLVCADVTASQRTDPESIYGLRGAQVWRQGGWTGQMKGGYAPPLTIHEKADKPRLRPTIHHKCNKLQ